MSGGCDAEVSRADRLAARHAILDAANKVTGRARERRLRMRHLHRAVRIVRFRRAVPPHVLVMAGFRGDR